MYVAPSSDSLKSIVISPLKLVAITNSVDLARRAGQLGIDRIMVDLEVRGKAERQTGLSLRLSGHTIDDVEALANQLGADQLAVRLDPWGPGSEAQIAAVLEHRPGILMLPMTRSADDVAAFAETVAGRAKLSLLVETVDAVQTVGDLLDAADVDELHIGLNDLRIDGGHRFLFEPVADGSILGAINEARARSIPCGVGGIARLDEGLVPGQLVLAALVHLEASAVILSRTFIRGTQATPLEWNDTTAKMIRGEIVALRAAEHQLRSATSVQRLARYQDFVEAVSRAVKELSLSD